MVNTGKLLPGEQLVKMANTGKQLVEMINNGKLLLREHLVKMAKMVKYGKLLPGERDGEHS